MVTLLTSFSWSCLSRGLAFLRKRLSILLSFVTIGSTLAQSSALKSLLPTNSGSSPVGAIVPVVTGNGLEARLAEARAQLQAENLTNAPAGVSTQDLWTRRALLARLVRLYEQQLSNNAELESSKARRAEVVRETQSWSRFGQAPPYSVHMTDRLREELDAERLRFAKNTSAVGMLDELVEEQRKALKLAEEKIRQLNEKLERDNDPVRDGLLTWQRALERVRSQVAAASVGVLETERLLRQENLEIDRNRVELLLRQLAVADAGAEFTQTDLEQATSKLERERLGLEEELAKAEARRTNQLSTLKVALEQLRVTQERREATADEIGRAREVVTLRETQLETVDTAIRTLRLGLECRNIERMVWELRFAAHGSRDSALLGDSEHRLESFIRRVDLWREQQRQQLEICSSQRELVQANLNNITLGSEMWSLARERLASLQERDQLLVRLMQNIERVVRLTQRWSEGLQAVRQNLPIAGRARNLFADAGSFLHKLWAFEVFSAEDTITVDGQKITGRRSVTISKIVMALLILFGGYWLSGLVSSLVEPIFIKRFRIEANQANLIRRWLRVMLVVCLVVFSLVLVKIPLTVFAFAGGALAIAFGFGLQTILKNFVSGLIILFERPFRVGDVLAVNNNQGTVTVVGLRASVLQLGDGTEMLIPNSALLEKELTNWTYSNRKVRFIVTVGVAYGSDPRRVIQVLNEVAERHGLVEKDPKPQVLFTEFGDSTLTFELRFWVDVSRANGGQVSSDLRLMIAASFAEQGISIDYPQRDIHLHATRPLTVEVVSSPGERRSSEAGANGPSRDASPQRFGDSVSQSRP